MFASIRNTVAAVLATATILGATSIAAQAGQDFTIENRSGVDVYEMYITPPHVRNWGNDMLNGGRLADGSSADVEMRTFGDTCIYDIAFVDVRGDSLEFYGVNVCANPVLILN